MNIFNAINKSFVIVWRNFILTQPFILFCLIFTILSGGLYGTMRNGAAFFIFTFSLVMLAVAFAAGWFYMTKKTIAYELDDLTQNEEEKALNSIWLIKHFFPGVGKYFLPVVAIGILYAAFSFVVFFVGYKLGIKFIGIPDINMASLSAASESVKDMQAYFASMPVDNALAIIKWFFYVFAISTGVQIVTMWWAPALFYNTKNPLKAFWFGVKFLFRKFGATLVIVFFLMLLNFLISLVTSAFGQNIVVSFISLVLYIFYVTYYVVLIFLYYGQNGEHSAKNYINSGDDSDGQKLASSEFGEEN